MKPKCKPKRTLQGPGGRKMPEFTPPNFRCRVSESDMTDGPILSRLVYATSAEEARAMLEKRYKVHSILSYNFEKWRKAAEREEKRVAKLRGRAGFKFRALWGQL